MKDIFYKYHLTPILCLLLVLTFFYFPVLFLGKTLQAPEMVQMNQNLKAAPTPNDILTEKVNPQIFNIELASAAYGYFPLDILVGNIYKTRALPLWNPYQGLGTPLAAGFETAAFFPLRILQDISPLSMRDWFFILEIWIAGIFIYHFFIQTNLNRLSGFFGATLYMGSGIFSWYFQLDNYLYIAMLLPLLMTITHLHAIKNSKQYIFVIAILSALIIYAGQPEAAFYAFVLSGCYFIYKIFSIEVPYTAKLHRLVRYILGIFLGILIASPLLFLFQQFLAHSFNGHISYYNNAAATITASTQHTPLFLCKGIIFPKLLDWANMPSPTSISESWDLVGGYIGVLGFYFLILGCLIKKQVRRKEPLFFFIFGATILLLNFGIWPFRFIAYLPIFDITLSEKFAGVTWDFAFIVTATYGFYFLQNNLFSQQEFMLLIKRALVIIGIFFYFILNLTDGFFYSWALTVKNLYHPYTQIIIVIIFTLALISSVTYYLLKYRHTVHCWIGCILALIVELQFIIPKGNYIIPLFHALNIKTNYLITQTIFLIVALLLLFAIFIYVTGKKISAFILGFIFTLLTIFLSSYAQPGYPKYQNVGKTTPFIHYLQNEAGYNRIFGLEGILDPYYASAYGLYDVRIVAALSIKTYQNFIQNYLMTPTITPLSQTFVTHFLFTPFEKDNPDHVVKFRSTLRRALNLLGVKYIIAPTKPNEDWAAKFYPDLIKNTKLAYADDFVKIYQNEDALPRVFIVAHYQFSKNYEDAQAITMNENFDMKKTAVLEENTLPTDESEVDSHAKIVSFTNNKVTIDATTNKPALLILTDIYFPGWYATIDGKAAKIYRADGLFRSVFITPGNHVIKFYYAPKQFKLGIMLMIFALIIAVAISFIRKKQET